MITTILTIAVLLFCALLVLGMLGCIAMIAWALLASINKPTREMMRQ
jgi:hypothetical protein